MTPLCLSCLVAVLLVLMLTTGPGCGGKKEASSAPVSRSRFAQALSGFQERVGKMVSVAAGGDVNLGNGVTQYLTSGGVGYPWPDASEVFSLANLSFVNLECCIALSGSPVPGKAFTFRGPADSAQGMASAGVDIVSVANNHSKDFGTEAFLETLTHLQESGVAWCGGGNNTAEAYSPTILEAKGMKVAFVGFTSIVPYGWPATPDGPGCATTYDTDMLVESLARASEDSDYVVATFHWGIELDRAPNAEQKDLARLAVDNGADLVLGHGPHVVQGFELYQNRLIAYSLGNFVFSPPREISSKTVGLIAVLGPDGLVQAKVVPMIIRSCRPLILEGDEASVWMETVRSYTEALGTSMRVTGGRGYIDGEVLNGGSGEG